MDDVSSMVESSSKVRNVYILMEGPDSRLGNTISFGGLMSSDRGVDKVVYES